MKSVYEEAGGTYTRQGDFELPNLKIQSEREAEIGVWGQRHRRYLKQYHRIWYYNLLIAGILNERLAEINHQHGNKIVRIIDDYKPSIYLYGPVVLDDFKLGWSDIDILVLDLKKAFPNRR